MNKKPFEADRDLATVFSVLPDDSELEQLQDFIWKVFQFYLDANLNNLSRTAFAQSAEVYQNLKTYLEVSHRFLKERSEERRLLSPLHLPSGMSKELGSALELIVLTVKPEKIFLIRHEDPVVEDTPHYWDLLIILSNQHQRKFVDIEPLVDFALSDLERVSFSLHVSGRLREAFEEGILFYVLNCTTENLIYDDGQKPLPVMHPDRVLANKLKAEATFLANHQMAKAFHQNAQHLFEQQEYNLSCFMLQQTAELCLRALITAFKGLDKKTHSISELIKHGAAFAPQLKNCFPLDTEEDVVLGKLLEEVYIKSRYEAGFKITPEQLMILMNRTAHLLTLAKEIFESHFKLLDQIV